MWSVAAGSLTGPHHRRRGEDNQDAVAVRTDEGPAPLWAVVTVADGAGSLPRSGEGAARAVAVAADAAAHHLGMGAANGVPLDAAWLGEAVRDGIAAAITDLATDPDAGQLGATLALAVAAPGAWAAGVVGDAFVVVTGADGTHTLIRPPAAGEYANITRLLTSHDPQPLFAGADEPVTAIAASSDGLDWATLQGGEPHPGFWTPLAARAQAGELDVAGLLAHMDAAERLDDDTTVAVAARSAP